MLESGAGFLRKVGKFFGQAEDYSGNRVIRKIKLEVLI